MSVPPYVTYVQNLSDEDLVDIVKELMAAKIIGRPEGRSKFSDCVAAVRDFFKNVNGFTDKDMAYIDGYAMAETTVRDEVFKRFIEIHDTQNKISVPDDIKIPYTNADKIRSMTDEELAEMFLTREGTKQPDNPLRGFETLFYAPDGTYRSARNYALQSWIDWLKQPVK